MPYYQKLNYKWELDKSIDLSPLEKMREEFPEPQKKPYIAWFMGSIDYYEDIYNFRNWKPIDIWNYLEDTAGGLRNYARLKIWVNWFHHFLPFLIEECVNKGYHVNGVMDYFYSLYPDEVFEEYFPFRKTIFNTIGKLIMSPQYWQDGDLIPPEWIHQLEEYKPEWYEDVGGPLVDCLEFCIKYLHDQDIGTWVKSITDIEGEVWRMQIRFYLNRIKKLNGTKFYSIPSERLTIVFYEFRKYPKYADI